MEGLLLTRWESLRGSTTAIADPPGGGELRSGSRIGIRANEGRGSVTGTGAVHHRLTSAVFQVL